MITQKPNIHEQISSVQFSCSFVFDSLGPHGLQCARPPCLSPTPGVYSNSCPELVMPSNHLILCCPLLFWPSIFLSIRVFSRAASIPYWPWLIFRRRKSCGNTSRRLLYRRSDNYIRSPPTY